MISLRARNLELTAGMKYSYLTTNYTSGINSVIVINSDGFSVDDYVLFGEWGNEISEIVKVSNVAADTHTLTLSANTKFSHTESTKIVIVKYNQVKFYQTATDVFDSSNLLGTIDVQPDSLFTMYQDGVNTTGFGWFKFFNSVNSKITVESNAIPYDSFANQSIKKVLDSFYSLLNNKEKKLITDTDSLNYLNEALAIVTSELNLVNDNYNVPADEDFSIVSGTSEYDLPDDFSKVISIYNSSEKVAISFIALSKVAAWNSETSNEVRYSLRNDKLIVSPTPTDSITYSMKYKKKSDIISSYYSNIDLPDHGEYLLIDFMMSRAAIKLQNGKELMFLNLFKENIQRLKISSHKRSNNQDDFGLNKFANI